MMDHEIYEKENSRISYSRKIKPKPVTLWDALKGDFYNSDVMSKLMRYESHIERGLYKALHELQRLQAARSGERVPAPVVVDVDLSGQEMGLLGEKG
jgi:hypothetical protein